MADPNIPNIPASMPPDQQAFAQALKGCLEILMGQGRNLAANRALRVSEYNSGIAQVKQDITTIEQGGSQATPEPPANLLAVKGMWSHHLSWDNPDDEIVSHIEVWVAINSQFRDNALLRGIVTVTPGMRGGKGAFVFSEFDITDDLTYWIRSVSYAGNHSEWCPSDAQGGYVVPGSESLQEVIDNILDVLQGEITKDQLFIDLKSEIDLISLPGIGLVDRLSSLEVSIGDIEEFTDQVYPKDKVIRYQDKIYICIKAITTTPAPLPTDTEYWEKIGEAASLAGNISANALAISNLDARVDTAEGGITAMSSSIEGLEAEVNANAAAIIAEQEARATEDSAVASSVTSLQATVEEPILLSWDGPQQIANNATQNTAAEWTFDSDFAGGAMVQVEVDDNYAGTLHVSLNGEDLTHEKFGDVDLQAENFEMDFALETKTYEI